METPPAVAAFPPPGGSNPYLRLLQDALERRGVRFSPPAPLTPGWVASARGEVDVIHLHWLEHIVFRPNAPVVQAAGTHAKAARFLAALTAARRAGMRIVWTIHNLRPHEPRYPWLDRALARSVLARADALIVHSEYAARRVRERMGPDHRIWVVPHGNYAGGYPPPSRPRDALRADLGVPDGGFLYLLFGQVRRYKRIPEALAAFRDLPDPDARALVAGWALDAGLQREVQAAAARDRRVVLDLRLIGEGEVSDYHSASDAAVLAYREVFSSGALLLALSFGLPVVAPAGGTAGEIAPPPATEEFSPGAMTAALAGARRGDPAARREAAMAAGARYSWDAMSEGVLAAYRGEPWAGLAPSGAAGAAAAPGREPA